MAVGTNGLNIMSDATLTADGQWQGTGATDGSKYVDTTGMTDGILYVTVGTPTGTSSTLVVSVAGWDPSQGKWVAVASTSSITAAGTTTLAIGLPGSGNPIPGRLNVTWTIGGTTPSFPGVYIGLTTRS